MDYNSIKEYIEKELHIKNFDEYKYEIIKLLDTIPYDKILIKNLNYFLASLIFIIYKQKNKIKLNKKSQTKYLNYLAKAIEYKIVIKHLLTKKFVKLKDRFGKFEPYVLIKLGE